MRRRVRRNGFGFDAHVRAIIWPCGVNRPAREDDRRKSSVSSAINDEIQADTQPTGFVAAMDWLKQNSSPQDVIMTRDPWELNWYTGRKAVMVPNDDRPTIHRVAKTYGVTFLQLGGPVDGVNTKRCPDATGSRPALGTLYCGEARSGFRLVYKQGGLTVYRVVGGQ